jgi:hypothetical protein
MRLSSGVAINTRAVFIVLPFSRERSEWKKVASGRRRALYLAQQR